MPPPNRPPARLEHPVARLALPAEDRTRMRQVFFCTSPGRPSLRGRCRFRVVAASLHPQVAPVLMTRRYPQPPSRAASPSPLRFRRGDDLFYIEDTSSTVR
jgi:hypothetical protein